MKLNKQAGFGPILLIIIIVAVLALGATLWWVFTQNNNSSEDAKEEEAVVIEGTMFDAIKQGESLECDWKLNYDGETFLTEGKFYTDGTNGRSETTYKYEGQTYEALAIIDKERTYHWSPGRSGSIQGLTDTRAEYEPREPKYDLLATSIDVDLNADYTFTCHPWTVDEAIFVPPSDLKFLFVN